MINQSKKIQSKINKKIYHCIIIIYIIIIIIIYFLFKKFSYSFLLLIQLIKSLMKVVIDSFTPYFQDDSFRRVGVIMFHSRSFLLITTVVADVRFL